VTGLCTLQLSRQLWPDLTSRSLPDLAAHFGLAHENPHRACDDATATAGVLQAALDEVRERGLVDLGELFRVEMLSAAASDEDAEPQARVAES